ncbi:ABC-type multidrug transport system, ATPase component [Desulfocapsa sulfexigens DSM 10523]|uniref:ABC-type multidrug transport system, ATPase component n=1 Tax=Desulfocapsa sulfexigens (strain DSM 10523 / SB164P1) TaxID=1167006 RepID=M1PQY9_DESSD|nr:ABC-type multidrug transport system, ATPase component [Desulfocapsa sulfexigens DSM 10523]
MQAISISNLTKVYKAKKGLPNLALDNLSLQINKGEVFGFLGPNGAGKSTTIKILLDLIRPTSGNAELSGINISDARARKTVGYLPEHPTFFDYLSAEEYLFFTGQVFGIKKVDLSVTIESLLRRLKLWEVRKKPLRIYSKGMVQRLGIAQVLVHNPDIYILDEPMSGLDPLGRTLVKEIILELKEAGKCVFLSSHIISDVEQICDRIGIIANGKLIAVEKVSEVMQKGIIGYAVHLIHPDGSIYEQRIDKNELTRFFTSRESTADPVSLIEPLRKDLEKYFLELINREQA